MTYNQMVFRMFKQKFYLYKNYFICNVLSLTMVFVFSTLIFNKDVLNEEKLGSPIYGFFIVCFVTSLLFSFIFTTISHKDYIEWKKNETGIFKVLGIEYLHLKNMFLIENAFIFTLSAISSLFIGTLFSRLFFICLMSLFNIKTISFQLLFEPYIVVICLCAVLFIYITIYDNLYIKKKGINILKNDGEKLNLRFSKSVLNKVNFKHLSFKTCLQLVISIILFTLAHIILTSWEKIGSESLKTMLVSLLLIFFGVNLFLRSFFHIAFSIKDKINKLKFPYFFIRNFLLSSLNRNRKLIYILTLLVHFVMFFSIIVFFYFQEVNEIISTKYPYHASINGKDENSRFLLSSKEEQVKFSKKLSIESIFLSQESENKEIGMFNFNVFSNKTYNSLNSCDFNIPKGHCLVASNPYFHKGNKNNPKYSSADTIELFSIESKNEYSFRVIDYASIDINNHLISSYVFIINDEDFEELKKITHIKDLYLYNFKNYEDSLKVYSRMKRENSYDNIFLLNNSFKIIEDNKMHSTFSGMAFMFIFVVILFLIAANTAIYSSFLSIEIKLRTLFSKLEKLGMAHHQLKKLVTHMIMFMMFLPFIIGSISGCYYSIMFPPEKGATLEILRTSVIIIGTIIIIQGIIISLFSRSLYKRIIN